VRDLSHAEIVDDERGDRREFREARLARPADCRLGDLFVQGVRFPIEDAIALLDRCAAEGLREVALAGPRHPKEQDVFAPLSVGFGTTDLVVARVEPAAPETAGASVEAMRGVLRHLERAGFRAAAANDVPLTGGDDVKGRPLT
jgi:hypothetical protein